MATHRGPTRREFTLQAASALVGVTAVAGCGDGPDYETLAASTWRHSSGLAGDDLLRDLVRYATLAPNSHNSQPWRFQIEPGRITITPDYARRCPAVDPDDHHLFASLGCATENLVLAARANGLHPDVSIDTGPNHAIRVALEQGPPVDSPLFQAIPERQCTRAEYDGRPVPPDQIAAFEDIARDQDVDVQVFTGRSDLAAVLEYVVAGNTAQMNDEAFVSELKEWIRFSPSAAVRHRDGLFTASSGNPTVPANWIGKLAFDFAFKTDGENDKYRRHIESSAGVIAFVAAQDDPKHWIGVGRAYQRFALQATAFGLRHAHINQAVEVPDVRAQFARYLGVGDRRPNLLVRFGHGPSLPKSLRRPVDAVTL